MNSADQPARGNTLVCDVPGFGTYRTELLYAPVHEYFLELRKTDPTVDSFPISRFRCRHLLEYGYRKFLEQWENSPRTKEIPDQWKAICQIIVTLLRTTPKLEIHSDAVIIEILSRACNLSTFSFCFFAHTEKDEPLFQSLGGIPESYKPLILDEEEATYVKRSLNLRTFNDIFVSYKFCDDYERNQWIKNFNACVKTPMTIAAFTNLFKQVKF